MIGDCGSWVIDRTTGEIYGHVIAGDGEVAYVVPAPQIRENIETVLEAVLSLPDEDTPVSAEAEILPAIKLAGNTKDPDERTRVGYEAGK